VAQPDDVRQPVLGLGHPEVYILILPALASSPRYRDLFRKALFGYRSMSWRTLAI